VLVEIKGVQFVNQGAHLMLLAVLERLRTIAPDAQVVLAPSPGSPYAQRAALGAWQKLPLRWRSLDLTPLGGAVPTPVTRLLRRYGVVTEHAIDAVLDASGYAYGDAWGTHALRATAAELQRYGRRGRPYVFLPQAFGPFAQTRAAAAGFGRALADATLVCARDEDSRAHLQAIAPALADRLLLCPDFTIGLAPAGPESLRDRVHSRSLLLIPNANMVRDPRATAGYVELLARAGRWARAHGYEPCVLNHEGAADAPLCTAIADALAADGPRPAIVAEPDPLVTKALIGAAAAVVCSRFHGCVNALAQGVPCLATSWSHKYEALYADFGVRDWVLRAGEGAREGAREVAREVARGAADAAAGAGAAAGADGPAIESLLADTLARRAAASAALVAKRAVLLEQVERMWQRVAAALGRAAGAGSAS
jgi:colanic acid/amylovoran biosynthesis protein